MARLPLQLTADTVENVFFQPGPVSDAQMCTQKGHNPVGQQWHVRGQYQRIHVPAFIRCLFQKVAGHALFRDDFCAELQGETACLLFYQ